MMIEIFGRIQDVRELNENIIIEGDRLYVFLKENHRDGKVYYEYQGSMLSTLEDKSTDFIKTFLPIATHYAVPPDEVLPGELPQLKAELDKNDRSLVFVGKEAV